MRLKETDLLEEMNTHIIVLCAQNIFHIQNIQRTLRIVALLLLHTFWLHTEKSRSDLQFIFFSPVCLSHLGFMFLLSFRLLQERHKCVTDFYLLMFFGKAHQTQLHSHIQNLFIHP